MSALGQIHPVIFPACELGFLTGNTEEETEKPAHKCNCAIPDSDGWRSPTQPMGDRFWLVFQESRCAPKSQCQLSSASRANLHQNFHNHILIVCVSGGQDVFQQADKHDILGSRVFDLLHCKSALELSENTTIRKGSSLFFSFTEVSSSIPFFMENNH